MLKTLSLVAAVALTSPLAAGKALACSGFRCTGAQVAPSAGTIPANLPGIFTTPGNYGFARAATLVRIDAAGSVDVDSSQRLLAPLVPGARYELAVNLGESVYCEAREVHAQFTAGDVAPIPTSLGRAKIVEQGRGATAVGFTGASCYSHLASAYADFEPSLDGDAAAWRDALVNVRAVVDGQPYWLSAEHQPQEDYYPTRGSGLRTLTGGDLRVRVFVACEAVAMGTANSYVPLSEGEHQVKLVGELAGVGLLETSETSVTLRCDDEAREPGAPYAATGEDQEGCGATGREPRELWPALLLMAGSAWLARRSKRSRRS